MKNFLSKALGGVVALAIMVAAFLPLKDVRAQSITQLPVAVTAQSVTDFGNGPVELRVLQGNAQLFTSQGSGLGSTSGSSTSITLTAVPVTPPCVGCLLIQSGNFVAPGSVTTLTVSAFNGVTNLTVTSAVTLGAGTTLAWGAACPSVVGIPAALVQAAVGGDFPFYTQARVCAGSPYSVGASVLPFAIGAH